MAKRPRHRHRVHHEDNGGVITTSKFKESLGYHTRQVLNDLANSIEVLVHAAQALDDGLGNVFADDEPDMLRGKVVAARAALLQVGLSLMDVEKSLGKLEMSAAVTDILKAEEPR